MSAALKEFYDLHRNRFIKFLVTGVGGLLVSEAIIAIGWELFGEPQTIPVIVIAGVVSITFGFFVNENWTMKDSKVERVFFPTIVRLGKFQFVYLFGNLVSWTVMLLLLHFISLSPEYGNIPGSAAALPVNYFISSRLVWRLKLI